MVGHFDSDGRRFMLARRDEPVVPEPRALTRRQRQVVFYASVGWSLKEVRHALGVADTTVASNLRAALDELGLASWAELVRVSTELAVAASAGPDGV